MSTDPQTPDEWQAAVDAADFMLLIDLAQQYGLIHGGEGVNVVRCVEILSRGADLGIFPTPDDRRRAVLGRWLRQQRAVLSISQHTLAKRAGVTQVWISLVEREKAHCGPETFSSLRATIERIRTEKETHEHKL